MIHKRMKSSFKKLFGHFQSFPRLRKYFEHPANYSIILNTQNKGRSIQRLRVNFSNRLQILMDDKNYITLLKEDVFWRETGGMDKR